MRKRKETVEGDRDRRRTAEEHRNTRTSTAGVESPVVERPVPSPLRGLHSEAEAHRVRMQ